MTEPTDNKSKSFRIKAHQSRYEKEVERKRKVIAMADIYITGNWILTDNAARMVNEKIEQMRKKNIRIGKEAAIQMLLNEMWNQRH